MNHGLLGLVSLLAVVGSCSASEGSAEVKSALVSEFGSRSNGSPAVTVADNGTSGYYVAITGDFPSYASAGQLSGLSSPEERATVSGLSFLSEVRDHLDIQGDCRVVSNTRAGSRTAVRYADYIGSTRLLRRNFVLQIGDNGRVLSVAADEVAVAPLPVDFRAKALADSAVSAEDARAILESALRAQGFSPETDPRFLDIGFDAERDLAVERVLDPLTGRLSYRAKFLQRTFEVDPDSGDVFRVEAGVRSPLVAK